LTRLGEACTVAVPDETRWWVAALADPVQDGPGDGAVPAGDEEHRTTGWEPDLDLGDTLLRQYVFALAETGLDLARAMGGRTLEEPGLLAADLGRRNAFFNGAVLTMPPAYDGWDALLARVEAFFAESGDDGEQVFLWSAWPTPDLRRRGWSLEGHPPLMARASGLPLPAASEDVEVREVRDADVLADFERVLVDGFPFEDLQPFVPGAWLDERVLAMPGHTMFVGYVDGQPATAGWVTVHGGLAVLTLGATLPAFRGRGRWTATVRRRLEVAGDLPTASIFADASRPIAEKHGFLPLLRFTLWHRPRRPGD
jgi:hypothetical protein